MPTSDLIPDVVDIILTNTHQTILLVSGEPRHCTLRDRFPGGGGGTWINFSPVCAEAENSQASRENATPSSGTSPLVSYKEIPPPPPTPPQLSQHRFQLSEPLNVLFHLVNEDGT